MSTQGATTADMQTSTSIPQANTTTVVLQQDKGLPTSGLAVAALVLGIIAFLVSFLPIANIGSIIMGLLGLVLGIIGLVGINKGRNKGKGAAIAGIVLSALALLITFIMYGSAAAIVAESASSSSESASSSAPAAGSTASESASAALEAAADASSQQADEIANESTTQEGNDAQSGQSDGGAIDAAKFDAISQGMSYEDVVSLIGSEGELLSTSTVAGIETSDYQWESEGWGIATVMFQDGAVINKTQVGVGGPEGQMTLDAFNNIEDGMTYDQVVELAGGEGELVSETELMGMTMSIYNWSGNSLLSTCTVTFEDGVVSSKSQYGLE